MKNTNTKEQVADSNGAQTEKNFLITGIQKITIPLQDIVFTSNEKSDRLIITKAGMHSKVEVTNDHTTI
jgi:hypothetical protein